MGERIDPDNSIPPEEDHRILSSDNRDEETTSAPLAHKDEGPSLEALLYQAEKEGVLPITSECNMACAFCSNHYNPPGCEVRVIGRRSFEEIKDTVSWLQGSPGPVVIGESVTRVNEGEPLTHPDFLKILKLVRDTYPERTVRVTTNGALLNHDLIAELAALKVDLIVSLNSAAKRKEVMGDPDPGRTLANLMELAGKVQFDGSIVALPFLTGWDDMRETSVFLRDCGAATIRLLLPGFSSRHPLYGKMTQSTWSQIKGFADGAARDLRIPVLCEPPGLSDTEPRVEFVLKGSPAERAGIEPGDLVVKVAGKETFSRKDAFEHCRERENPQVTVLRGGAEITFALRKDRRQASGLVMYEDLDRDAWLDWERSTVARKGGEALILTSSLAKPVIDYQLEKRGLCARVIAVKSRFFGGNIQAGGLLTVRDFVAAFRKATEDGYSPVEVTLPKIAFDNWGRDLEGVHYRAFARKAGRNVLLAG